MAAIVLLNGIKLGGARIADGSGTKSTVGPSISLVGRRDVTELRRPKDSVDVVVSCLVVDVVVDADADVGRRRQRSRARARLEKEL